MPAFSGLYDGVHGDGYAALRNQTEPPMLRGIVRVLMQKRGMHGVINALGRTAPATIARINADRGDIVMNGGYDYANRQQDAANRVTVTNLSSAYASETIARVPNASADDLAHAFDITINEGFVKDDADSGATANEVVADPLVAPV